MIDFVSASPSLRKAYWVAMVIIHFHIAQTRLYITIFSHSGGSQGTVWLQSKSALGSKVGQIRSGGSLFEAEIRSFLMFVYCFTLFIGFNKYS